MTGERCADLSLAAGERLAATATTAERWLLVEVPGTWPRDVTANGALPERVRDAVSGWVARTPGSRVLFIRRPGRFGRNPLAFVVGADESTTNVTRIELDSLDDLADVDLDTAGSASNAQLVLVCGHGTRDQCCALRGTAVYGALASSLGDEELWISSHHGGHRFAANVLVLPAGLHFGRIEPDDASFVVARALAGRIELQNYRGRTCYPRAVQAAEWAVREAAGIDGVTGLRLESTDGSVVRFRSWDGAEHAAIVEEVSGPIVPASCGAEPESQNVFSAQAV